MDQPSTSAQGTPSTPEWRRQVIAEFTCPACSYDLTHNPVPRCPECGYVLTEDDISLSEYRRIFLSLTSTTTYIRHGFVAILLLMVIPYVGVLLALPPVLSVLLLHAGKGKGLVPRVRRRVWLMSAFWIQMPWVLVGLAPAMYEMISWRLLRTLGLPDDLLDWPEEILAIGVAATFAGFLWWWRHSLHRLSQNAALPEDDPIVAWRSPATRVALVAYALAGLLVLVPVMLWTLDTFWPGWA